MARNSVDNFGGLNYPQWLMKKCNKHEAKAYISRCLGMVRFHAAWGSHPIDNPPPS